MGISACSRWLVGRPHRALHESTTIAFCFFWFFGHFRDAARVGLGLATTRPSQRHPSWETAIELTTKTARQRQLRALLLVSLLEPIFEKDAIEARCFAK